MQAREATIIEEIRRVCGVTAIEAREASDAEADEVAADIEADVASADDFALLEAEPI